MRNTKHEIKYFVKKIAKTGTMLVLTLAIIGSQIAPMSFADSSKGNGNDNGSKSAIFTWNKASNKIKDVDPKIKAELRERLHISAIFTDGNLTNLPAGMVKKGYLNYGLAKKYEKGDFPFGLAKRMQFFFSYQNSTEQPFDALKTLIDSANVKLTSDKYTGAAKAILQSEVKKAQTFVDSYDSTKASLVKTQYEALKAAVHIYENSEVVSGDDYITKLKSLLDKLVLYRTDYYAKLTSAKKTSLDNLIAMIQSYVKAPITKVLTLGAYNEMFAEAKSFTDHLGNLKILVAEIETFLYVDPAADTKELKVFEGSATGTYLAGSISNLQAAVVTANNYITTYKTASTNSIDLKYKVLNIAFTTFKENIILGEADRTTVSLLKAELDVYKINYYNASTNPLPALAAMISEMESVIENPPVHPLTQAKLNRFIDASQKYIKDLYDPLKLELIAAIAKANDLLTDTQTYDSVEKAALALALEELVNSAQDYLKAKVFTYSGLVAHINNLSASIDAMKEL